MLVVVRQATSVWTKPCSMARATSVCANNLGFVSARRQTCACRRRRRATPRTEGRRIFPSDGKEKGFPERARPYCSSCTGSIAITFHTKEPGVDWSSRSPRPWNTIPSRPIPAVVRNVPDGVIALLRRPEGATVEEVASAMGWQRHTVRGLFSGTLKKKLGLTLASAHEERGRGYRVAAPASA